MDALNKKRYRTFRERCHGSSVTEVHVDLRTKGRNRTVLYNARDRAGKTLADEWTLSGEAAGHEEQIRTLIGLLREDFVVVFHDAELQAMFPEEAETRDG